ncbi:MAG: COX15/CtaA family protein [Gemmataceae bacterium]|nr:COX15/CtaA family protein [Gemmataceae bacterium]
MTDPAAIRRPVPRWLHAWAVLTAAITFVTLIVLGQMVTSFRAGMADPVWPTEPWYLASNYRLDLGYLIEHTHRIAGFLVGGAVSLLVLGVWWTAGPMPPAGARWLGLLGLVGLLVGFGEFHRALMAQRDAAEVVIPREPAMMMGLALLVTVGAGLPGIFADDRRPVWLRLFAVGVLVAVMVQGLLGGFRVRLDALFGPELAPVHGVFGQLTFALLVTLAVLTAKPPADDLPPSAARPVRHLTLVLVVLLVVQLVWGALVRHRPDSLNQRLHLLTAFLVVATAAWLLRVGFTSAARPRVMRVGWVLGALVAVQVTLGVEAWMGKFGDEARRGRPAGSFLPEAEAVTVKQAALRTAHALVGTGVLAAAVTLALRVRVRAAGVDEVGPTADGRPAVGELALAGGVR